MKIYISKIDKKNLEDIYFFKYKGSKNLVSLIFWYEQLEPKYVLNKIAFINLFKKYMNCEEDIVDIENEIFNNKLLIKYLKQSTIVLLENLLEKIWIDYKFIVMIR